MKPIKLVLLGIVSVFLVACGGGSSGGSSNVRQFSNSAPIVNITDGEIPSAGNGVKDPYYMAGGGYGANIVDTTGSIYPNGVTVFDMKIRGNISGDGPLNVPNPPRDIRTAWRNGWTGKGVNILIADTFSTQNTHGFIVTMSAIKTAPRASYYGVELGLEDSQQTYRDGGLFNRNGNRNINVNTKIDVINMSFGSGIVQDPNTNTLRNAYINNPLYKDILQGNFLTNTQDAVLVKAAGNESANSNLVAEHLFFATDETTKKRILIVGALNKYAQNGNAEIAGYSNLAGDNESVSRRFLVEYGGSPFGENAYLCTKDFTSPSDCNLTEFSSIRAQGTSFAAPRVSGLAALVRHKFDNLSGAQTAKILLDTATTEGLSCHPSCDVQIYGQGRVSITDALAPIGKLR